MTAATAPRRRLPEYATNGRELARRTTVLLRERALCGCRTCILAEEPRLAADLVAHGFDETHANFVAQTAEVLSRQFDGANLNLYGDEPPPDLLDAVLLANYWADRA